jgi:hypothetical protein
LGLAAPIRGGQVKIFSINYIVFYIAGIGFAPVFDALAVFRPAEVILVLWTLLPAALTLRFTLLAACQFGAVSLVTHITMIRYIESQQRHLRLAEPFIGKLKKFETPPLQDQSFGAEQNPGKRNKMKKSEQKSGHFFFLHLVKKSKLWDDFFHNLNLKKR